MRDVTDRPWFDVPKDHDDYGQQDHEDEPDQRPDNLWFAPHGGYGWGEYWEQYRKRHHLADRLQPREPEHARKRKKTKIKHPKKRQLKKAIKQKIKQRRPT